MRFGVLTVFTVILVISNCSVIGFRGKNFFNKIHLHFSHTSITKGQALPDEEAVNWKSLSSNDIQEPNGIWISLLEILKKIIKWIHDIIDPPTPTPTPDTTTEYTTTDPTDNPTTTDTSTTFNPETTTTQYPDSSTTENPDSSTTENPYSSSSENPDSSTTENPCSSTTENPSNDDDFLWIIKVIFLLVAIIIWFCVCYSPRHGIYGIEIPIAYFNFN
jgi:hypothetical protein